jgi:hypothetical protein
MTSSPSERHDAALRAAFIAALVLACLALRVLALPPINYGTDEVWVWANAKKLVLGYPFSHWDHHTGRLFTVGIAVVTQLAFGTDPWVYHVAPIAAYAVGCGFLVALALRLASYEGALLAWFGWIALPDMVRRSADHLSDLFAATLLLIALHFMVRLVSRASRSAARDVAAMAVLCFLAYSAKETAVLFFPGMFLSLWFAGPHRRWALVWAGLLFALFVGETLFIDHFAGVTLGRYALMKKVHLQNQSVSEVAFADLLTRFVEADRSWRLLFALTGVSALLWYPYRKRAGAVGVWAFLVPVLSFLIFLAFSVRSVRPLVPALPFRDRYLMPSAGPLLLSIAVLSRPFFEALGAKLRPLESPRATRLRRVATAVVLLAAGAYGVRGEYKRLIDPKAVPRLLAFTRTFRKAYDRNTPILASASNKTSGKRLYVLNAVFRPDLFTDASRPDEDRYKSLGAYDPKRVTLKGRAYLVIQKDPVLSPKTRRGPVLVADAKSSKLKKLDVRDLKSARD